MDDGWPNLVEVLEGIDDLHDDRAALLLAHQLILLQVEVQIIAFTVLQHCAEPATGSAVHRCLIHCHCKNISCFALKYIYHSCNCSPF